MGVIRDKGHRAGSVKAEEEAYIYINPGKCSTWGCCTQQHGFTMKGRMTGNEISSQTDGPAGRCARLKLGARNSSGSPTW